MMIRPASFIYLKADYLSHGVKILGLSVKTVGRLLFLRANAAKASSFAQSVKMQRCI